MFELLAKASVVFDNKNIILDVLDKVITYITTDGEFLELEAIAKNITIIS